jgi:predicted anti-sigma-YlaC factor YlaD
MVIRCEHVWREISNYLDGDVDPILRAAMEEHFHECKDCLSVLEGTRNVIQLYGDERMIPVPLGYSYRLHRRLQGNMPGSRRSFLGWMVAAAAAVVTIGTVEVASSVSGGSKTRSELAREGTGVPPDLLVVVSEGGKTFHIPECSVIHDRAHLRTLAAREAEQQGFVPCVRCLKQYLKS